MVFNSWSFLLFLCVVLAGYFVLRWRWQNWWLLLASWVFYGSWDPRLLLLLLLSAGVNFWLALHLSPSSNARGRKALLVAGLCFNVGLLAAFKYARFFEPTLRVLFAAAGVRLDATALQVLLPIGLSFYTFQLIGYSIDVYRGSVRPCRRLDVFLLFASFFPYLVAGPITRAASLLPQFEAPRRVDWSGIRAGVFLVLSGLFKKVAVADALAPYVAIRFASPAQCTGPDLVLALLCYSVEIYCDFSGYSDIARGSGKLMGFELPVNFRQPYLSRSITEFWQRWHISLSSWFRDYLFLPLDYAFLRRVPELQMLGLSEEYWGYVFSTTLTMAICGAWHGSQLTFVVWGAAHGALLAGHRVLLRFRKPSRRRGPWPGTTLMSLGKGIGCFLLVTVLWIPFRSPDFQSAREFLTGIRWID